MKVFAVVTVLLICAMFIVSCSNGENNPDSSSLAETSTQPDSRGLNAAAKIVAQGIIDANGDAVFAQISRACQQKISRLEVSKQLKTSRAYLTTFLGASMDDFSVKSVETRNVKKGEIGQARYTIVVKGDSRKALAKFQEEGGLDSITTTTTAKSNGSTTTTTQLKLPFDEPTDWFDFVYESSSWRLESCQEFLAASGALSSKATTTTSTTPTTTTTDTPILTIP